MAKRIFVPLLLLWVWTQTVPPICLAQENISPDCKRASRTMIVECPHQEPICRDLDFSYRSAGNSVRHWERALSSVACYRAVVQNIDLGLYEEEDSRLSGEACLTLNVIEVLWGPKLSTLSVWATGVDFPGCITYGGNYRFDQLDHISPGTEVLAMCGFQDGCWNLGGIKQFYLVGGDSPYGVEESDLEELRALAIRESIVYQSDRSSLICKADFVGIYDDHHSMIRVTSVVRGNTDYCNQELLVYWPIIDRLREEQLKGPNGHVMFLRELTKREKENISDWFKCSEAEDGHDKEKKMLPKFAQVDSWGGVVMPELDGYHDCFGTPAGLPELLGANK